MTDVAAWLVGLVSCTGMFLLFYLGRTLLAQVQAGPVVWRDSKPMRLVLAMALLVVSLFVWMAAAADAPTISPIGKTSHMVWAAFSGIWLAELIALSAIGRVGPALCVCSIWTLYTIATRFMV